MQPLEIRARDGLTLTSYLTLPPAATAFRWQPDSPVPMVMVVHGGPGLGRYGYNSAHQWLANRGYAVMSVNFRGSTGFGKKFISAGTNWRTSMQDDLADALAWAVRRASPRRTAAIMGGSYGGYAVLANLAFYPDRFACEWTRRTVEPGNAAEDLPAYWCRSFASSMTGWATPTARGSRRAQGMSPLYAADKISRPLLIARAPTIRASTRRKATRSSPPWKGEYPVTYVLFPDEGHGFRSQPTTSPSTQ